MLGSPGVACLLATRLTRGSPLLRRRAKLSDDGKLQHDAGCVLARWPWPVGLVGLADLERELPLLGRPLPLARASVRTRHRGDNRDQPSQISSSRLVLRPCRHGRARNVSRPGHMHRMQQLLLWLVDPSREGPTTVRRWDDDALSHERQHASAGGEKRMRGNDVARVSCTAASTKL